MNASSVFERVKKLERRGIITGYVATVNPEKLGKPLLAFIRVTIEALRLPGASSRLDVLSGRTWDSSCAEDYILGRGECQDLAGEKNLAIISALCGEDFFFELT